jgi:hypothetical protein
VIRFWDLQNENNSALLNLQEGEKISNQPIKIEKKNNIIYSKTNPKEVPQSNF